MPVASGNFVIGGKKKIVLDAYLGTCVGVAMFDRTAEVGGLLHILLPEWTGYEKPWRASIYATTGVPVFIKALSDAGADVNRLEAWVAGGALVGPVSQRDLDLDVGGRTVDVVHSILKRRGINICNEETGGYFSCRLSVDLNTFECDIQPIIKRNKDSTEYFKKPTPDEISRSIDAVRPIPQVALKLVRIIRESDYNMKQIATEVKQDQVISANVIRLCNSSYVGLQKKVDTIDRALVIMGEKLLLQMVLSASMELYFSDSSQGYSLCKGGLFQHALGTATIAEELAKFTGRSEPQIAYTAGLVHDIGKVVLDKYISAASPFFYRRPRDMAMDLFAAEKEKIGFTHPEAGALLAREWGLPDNLIDIIRYHHSPEAATVDPELCHLVYLADFLMSRFKVGQELERMCADRFAARLQRIGLSTSQFPVIVDLIPQRIFDLNSLLL